MKSLWSDFAVFGSMGGVNECLTRLVGQENAMVWMAEHPQRLGAVINRIGEHYLECAKRRWMPVPRKNVNPKHTDGPRLRCTLRIGARPDIRGSEHESGSSNSKCAPVAMWSF